MVWGYLQLTGQIEEPFVAGLKRLVTLAVVIGGAPAPVALQQRSSSIPSTARRRSSRPTRSSARRTRSRRSMSIWSRGGAVAGLAVEQRRGVQRGLRLLRGRGDRCGCSMGLLCVYTMFLIALSSIALAVLLALGSAVHRAAALRGDPALLRGVARAAGQLRPDHHSHGAGGGAAAADRRVLRRADRRARRGDPDRRCAATWCWSPCSCSCFMRQVMPIAVGAGRRHRPEHIRHSPAASSSWGLRQGATPSTRRRGWSRRRRTPVAGSQRRHCMPRRRAATGRRVRGHDHGAAHDDGRNRQSLATACSLVVLPVAGVRHATGRAATGTCSPINAPAPAVRARRRPPDEHMSRSTAYFQRGGHLGCRPRGRRRRAAAGARGSWRAPAGCAR